MAVSGRGSVPYLAWADLAALVVVREAELQNRADQSRAELRPRAWAWRGVGAGVVLLSAALRQKTVRVSVSRSPCLSPLLPSPQPLPSSHRWASFRARGQIDFRDRSLRGDRDAKTHRRAAIGLHSLPCAPAPCSLPGLQHNAKWSREVAECSTPLAGATYLLGVYLSKVLGLRLGQLRRLGLAA